MKWILSAMFCMLWMGNVGFAESLPNIVLLMGDDHGWEETGYNGHPYVKTPVLDEMAETAFRFDCFHAGHASCSPTRASFLTGRHPNRMGTFSAGWSFRPEEITLAHVLSKAGYRTAHFGKWHIGAVKSGSPVNPGAMGFDEWLSHDNFFEMNPSLSRNGAEPKVFQGESSAILVQEAIEFIERTRKQEQPFLVVVWYGSPHEPYSGLPKDLALYDDLPKKYSEKMVSLTSNETGERVTRPQGEVLRERFAEITAMDRSIGTLRKYLSESELRENTMLFYCGDNGTSSDGWISSPHRGHKTSIYNGGTMVPGLLEWPRKIPEPRSSQARVSTVDLLPTLAGITGQKLSSRPLDGISFESVLTGEVAERPEPLYFWSRDNASLRLLAKQPPYIDPELQEGTTPLVKQAKGKFTRSFLNYHHHEITEQDYRGQRAVISGQYKLVVQDGREGKLEIELFDLKSDPGETKNIMKHHPKIASRLKIDLKEWQSGVLRSVMGEDYRD